MSVNNSNRRLVIQRVVIRSLIAILLLMPLVLYVATFGTSLSSDHTRWSEMGSAMAGIYTPILTILTLIVLITQVRLQGQMNRLQNEMYIQQYDQRNIQQIRSDLQHYLKQLDYELSKNLKDGITVREFLHQNFTCSNIAELKSEKSLLIAKDFHKNFSKVGPIWSAILIFFLSLKSRKTIEFELEFPLAIQKTVIMISIETCIALDNYIWCKLEGEGNQSYEFSPILITVKK